jgi:hypothetical protein
VLYNGMGFLIAVGGYVVIPLDLNETSTMLSFLGKIGTATRIKKLAKTEK